MNEGEHLVKVIVEQLGSLLYCIFNVPSRYVNAIVEELQFIVGSASASVIQNIVCETLGNHDCTVEELVITDLVKHICQLNSISVAFSKEATLSTAYNRNIYFREHFSVVEPIECILNTEEDKSFQYIPILQSPSHILKNSDIQEKVLKSTPRSTRHVAPHVSILVFVTVLTLKKTHFCLEKS